MLAIDHLTPDCHDNAMFSQLFNKRFQTLPTTQKFSFAHGGRILNVTLRRRRNAKRLTMRVRDGALSLTTPPDITNDDAADFIRKHYDWVDQQLTADDRMLHAHVNTGPMGDDTSPANTSPAIWYLGALTPVKLRRDDQHQGRSRVTAHPDHIEIVMSSATDSRRLRPDAVLEAWLKKQAKSDIQTSLDEVLPLINEAPVPLAIRDQKTRWGSCSTTRRLSFNWRLIMAPPECLHYVVVHEAAHLIHHDHSSRFWGLVAELMPDFKPHQQWLKTHQQDLFTGIDRRLNGLKPTL